MYSSVAAVAKKQPPVHQCRGSADLWVLHSIRRLLKWIFLTCFTQTPSRMHADSYAHIHTSISPLQFPSVQMKYIWRLENAPQRWGIIYLTNIGCLAAVHVIFMKATWQWVMSTMFMVNRLSICPKCSSTCHLLDGQLSWPIQRLILVLHSNHCFPDHICHVCPLTSRISDAKPWLSEPVSTLHMDI